MEFLAICFCVVIAHAFGYLERGQNGKREELRVNENTGEVVSRHAKQAFSLDRHIRLKDVRITVNNNFATKSNEIVTSTPSTVVTPLTATSTASKATNISAKVLESSPRASKATNVSAKVLERGPRASTATNVSVKVLESSPRASVTNFLNKVRSLLGRKIMYDSIDPYHTRSTEAIFKKMLTRLEYAINLDKHALLREHTESRKETDINEIFALSEEANHEGRNLLTQLVQDAGSRAAELIVNHTAMRRKEDWITQKGNHSLTPTSKTPSAFPTRHENLTRDEYDSIETLLNAAGEQLDERAKAEEVENASAHQTENARIIQAEKAARLERSHKQRRMKRQTNETETAKVQEEVKVKDLQKAEKAKDEDPEMQILQEKDKEKAKDEEAEMQLLQEEDKVKAKDEKTKKGQTKDTNETIMYPHIYKTLGANDMNQELSATIEKDAAEKETEKGKESHGRGVLLLIAIAFAVVVQLIIIIMVLVKYRTEIAEWLDKMKKQSGEKEPLQPAKKVSAIKSPSAPNK